MALSNQTIAVYTDMNETINKMIRFGVMGASGGAFNPALIESCRKLGKTIAESRNCLLTGACPGLPHEVVLGAYDYRGHIIGISPAASEIEHIARYDSPVNEYDIMIYTGLGLMGRELINIRSSDVVVIVGGRSGTLGEFSIAFEEGKLIGVLDQSGGITKVMHEIVASCEKDTGAEVLYDADPVHLVERLLIRHRERMTEATSRYQGQMEVLEEQRT